VCSRILVENEVREGTFVSFIECLKTLGLTDGDPAEALVAFLLAALHESGYPVDLGYYEDCDGDMGERLWFDFADGKFTSEARLESGARASVCTYHLLRKCAGLFYDEEELAGGRKRALRLLKAYLSEKTETPFENLGEFLRLYEENELNP
jgi:recombinational DNA repair protein (RecF pathway)